MGRYWHHDALSHELFVLELVKILRCINIALCKSVQARAENSGVSIVPEQFSLLVTASSSRSCDPGSIPPHGGTFLTTPTAPYLESYVRAYSQAQLSSAASHPSMTRP